MGYQGKRVAILGYGTEGKSAYRYFSSQGAQITICDRDQEIEVPSEVETRLGPDYLKHLANFDLIVRSPGVLPYQIHASAPVTSVIDEFLTKCPATVIGVTGSKGKGTTAALIYEILKAANKTVFLGGNIGKPPLDFLDQVNQGAYVVLELSNLQLWDITDSPQIAVILEIFPEHLDWHRGNLEEYLQAKANIVKFQEADDLAVYNSRNQYAHQIGAAAPGRKLPYLDKSGAYIEGGHFKIAGNSVAETADVQLIGQHNLENVCAAIAATWQIVEDPQAIQVVLHKFRGLGHRLEFVREVAGVRYYDDSIGTTPEATIAAIRSFLEPKLLILGGSDKGAEFSELAMSILANKVKQVVVIGETAPKITAALTRAGYPQTQISSGLTEMKQVVKTAAAAASSGDVVLLSPACASFGLFKDYKDRGDQFKQAVEIL